MFWKLERALLLAIRLQNIKASPAEHKAVETFTKYTKNNTDHDKQFLFRFPNHKMPNDQLKIQLIRTNMSITNVGYELTNSQKNYYQELSMMTNKSLA